MVILIEMLLILIFGAVLQFFSVFVAEGGCSIFYFQW